MYLQPSPSPHDQRKTILVVDDTKENLTVLAGLLGGEFRVRVANSGERALKAVRLPPLPDLILLDVMMPGMDGYAVLKALRADAGTHHIPVIFVTAMSADEDEEHGLALGAVDYVTKPIRAAILQARVRAHLELKQARDTLASHNDDLEREVRRRMGENELIKAISLNALATLAEKRDNETGNHLYRTQAYIEILMRHLATHPDFCDQLDPGSQELIAKAAPLHDIGKVGIPDAILLKPGKLTPEEFEIMKTHSQIGADALGEAIERVLTHSGIDPGNRQGPNSSLSFLDVARQIALHHHEKWDGSGYPHGLAGDAIPLPGRLMALADVFDALTCKRHYKEAFTPARVHTLITEGRGVHFDPRIVDAFLELEGVFLDIAARYRD
ncbi:HD domain-containing phosphohydrolase [Zoogloea sp.]|uniref:HD-GYP domain-containing protein n=1 Tax=Zoogloea sp. TaxID=49181 RepID=UPI00261C371B|nr:HD domain-containing phosphohydrolase [Zoogloea sp.]MDD3354240.1 response regulator [Zoogloea sp.]